MPEWEGSIMRISYRILLTCLVIAVIMGSTQILFGASSISTTGRLVQRYFLSIGGAPAGIIGGYSGWKISAAPIEAKSGQTVVKHTGPAVIQPVTLNTGFTMSNLLSTWIRDSWNANPQRKDFTLTSCDINGNPKYNIQCKNAVIAYVTVPACDALSKNSAALDVSLVPESLRETAPVNNRAMTEVGTDDQKGWASSRFKLEIDGLDCSGVTNIDSFTVTQGNIIDRAGAESRDFAFEPGAPQFPNLTITVDSSHADTWKAWFDDFVIRGNNKPGQEKTGRLYFMSETGKSLACIVFHGVGIYSYERIVEEDDSASNRIRAGLYCNKMEFQAGSVIASSPQPAEEPPSPAETSDSSALTPTDDCQIGQKYRVGNENPINLTVNRIEYTVGRLKTGSGYSHPGADEKFMILHYTLQNPQKEDINVGRVSIDWRATDVNEINKDQEYVCVEETGRILDQILNAGQSINCYTYFTMPADGPAVILTGASHGDRKSIARYRLDNKVEPLPESYRNTKDPSGATPLSSVSAELGTVMQVGDYDMKVEKVETITEPILDWEQHKDTIYMLTTIECKSFAEQAFGVPVNNIVLEDADGQIYDQIGKLSVSSMREIDPKPDPGTTIKFRLAYRVPKGIRIKNLVMKYDLSRRVVFIL